MNDEMSQSQSQPWSEADRRTEQQLEQALNAETVLREAGIDPSALDRRVVGMTRPLVRERLEANSTSDTAGRIQPQAGATRVGRSGLSLGWRIAAMIALASMISLVVAVWRVDVTAQSTALAAGASVDSQATDSLSDQAYDILALQPLPDRDVDVDLDLLALQLEQVATSDVFVSPDQTLDEAIHHDQVMLWTDDAMLLF